MEQKVLVAAGKSVGMFYTAPEGTALPTYPGEALAAAWELVGDVGEDGLTLTLPNGEVIRNWALQPKRKINTESGSLAVPVLDTTQKVLETLFGEDNVDTIAADSTHGNVSKVTLSPDVSAEPAAYLFLIKDGDTLCSVGTTSGLITNIDDVPLNGTEAVIWNASIQGDWEFAHDDGQTV